MKLWCIGLCCVLALLCGCGGEEEAATPVAALSMAGMDSREAVGKLQVVDKGAQPGVWTSDWDAAVKLATEKRVPIVVFFAGSDWAPSTGLIIEKILLDEEWAAYAKGEAVLAFLDLPRNTPEFPKELKARNEALLRGWGVRQVPALMLCTSDGKSPWGILDVNAQPSAHDAVRWAKRVAWQMPSVVERHVEGMKDAKVSADLAAWQAAQKAFEAAQKQLADLDKARLEKLNALSSAREKWVVAHGTAEEQKAYAAAQEALQKALAAQKELQQKGGLEQPEQQKRWQELQLEIQKQAFIIQEIVIK